MGWDGIFKEEGAKRSFEGKTALKQVIFMGIGVIELLET